MDLFAYFGVRNVVSLLNREGFYFYHLVLEPMLVTMTYVGFLLRRRKVVMPMESGG